MTYALSLQVGYCGTVRGLGPPRSDYGATCVGWLIGVISSFYTLATSILDLYSKRRVLWDCEGVWVLLGQTMGRRVLVG